MSKENHYMNDSERLVQLRAAILDHRVKFKVSEPQIARYCDISLATLRKFLQGNNARYHRRIIHALEKYCQMMNVGLLA